jgi:hypothetical protein
MRKLLVCLLFFFAVVANAQTPPSTPALPYNPSLDLASMDKSVDPCVDLYHYACGGWQKKNPIPPDQTAWAVYAKLYQDNLAFLRGMLEQAAQPGEQRDAVTQKIGDFYSSCMDESAVEKRGLSAIQPELDAIDQLKATKDLTPQFHQLHKECHTRLKQPLFCPVCNRNVERSEIVKGYEYEKDQYVLFNEEELDKIEPPSARVMEILEFVKLDEMDPLYFDSSYFLSPEEGGVKAYQLLMTAMKESGPWSNVRSHWRPCSRAGSRP